MGKNDFDIDFDFNEEYNFDPKSFLGDEAYDENIDVDAIKDAVAFYRLFLKEYE